ncbi:aspartate kinase [Nannocystis bainbridge]|uniref:Aspartokinase n=1 Tax=Nannocystis bainbridge TaxID=2995303 RepID=A0ABT5DP74_9BACT|nr:aspartate kinase [Nannocystis bainbridge]MDC0715341.1 aspartate kinase [Nannocystis bainbridge]
MLIVQKFGGSSVATLERIRNVAERALATQRAGQDVVVVVSAMAGETNRLIGLANALASEGEGQGDRASKGPYLASERAGDRAHERELDQLVSTGENVSAALLAMAIQNAGGRAISLVGHQIGLQTDGTYTNARILGFSHGRIRQELTAGKVVVCAGFQGLNAAGNITTLGRGGSDTSAVALAAALKADACEILTDVDGVYTTDPRVEPRARKIHRITYEEMLELASLGAKVLQIRSVEFAMKFGVPVHVRSSLNDSEGTWIVSEQKSLESAVVTGVALDRNEAKVTLTNVPDVPGTIASIFGALAGADIVVDMIIQNASRGGSTDVTFTVPENDLKKAVAGLRSLDLLPGAGPMEILSDPDICKISIVGVGMRTHAGVASKAFEILARENINIQMVSTSEIKVSVVVHERYGELALRALHAGFGLHEGPTSSAA